MATKGTAVLDFGSGNQLATTTVSAATVAVGSKIEPYVMLDVSADHNEDEHLLMMSMTVFSCPKSLIVAGVSFTIRGFSDQLLYGKYTVNYVGDF